VTELLFGFWVITVAPDFVSCYGPQEEITVVADFIQQFQVHTCHWCCWVVQTLQKCTARSNSAVEFASIFHMKDLPAVSEMVLHWSLFMTLQSFSMFLCVLPVEGWCEHTTFSQFLCEWRKLQKVSVLPVTLWLKSVLSVSCICA